MIAPYKLKPSAGVTPLQTYTDDADLLGVQTGVWQIYPQMYYYDGYTYQGATKNVSNRDPILLRFNQRDNSVIHVDVGTIDNFDPIFHQRPIPIEYNGFIYVIQVNGHGQDIKIWKSNTTDVADGFTLDTTISDNNYGYINLHKRSDDSIIIGSRLTTQTPYNYGHVLVRSSDWSTFSSVITTDPDYATTNHRHYMMLPLEYGTNTWLYVGIMSRNDSGNQYFSQGYYKTQDFNTFYSLDETFNKNVASTTPVTDAEVETNFNIIGSTASDTVRVQASNGCVIDDVIYGSYFDNVTDNYWRFYKITGMGVKTEYECTIVGLDTDRVTDTNSAITITYNGNNLVWSFDGAIYTCDLEFNNQKLVFQATDTDGNDLTNNIYPMSNIQDVNGRYALFIGGGGVGTARYYITSDKFIR